MTLRTLTSAAALLALSTPAFAMGHAGQMGYGLLGDGTTLALMADIAAPADVTTVTLAMPMDAIAWRPVTGELYGFSKAGTVQLIDPATGTLTDTGAVFAAEATMGDDANVAFDFNNAIDAVRAVSSDGVNLVYFPTNFEGENANQVKRFTDLAYAEGDASFGKTPDIFANAYTNAIVGAKASGTAQYALDAEANALVTLANNDGTLATVGLVTIDGEAADILPMGGFDITSMEEGSDLAVAVLQLDGAETAGLYQIDLATGAASLIGDIGVGGFRGFAASLPN